MRLSRPPSCLQAWTAQPTDDPGVELEAVVEEWPNTFFEVACTCGGTSFAVRSHFNWTKYFGEYRAYGPITFRCATCQREAGAFDPALHGHDAELDHFPPRGPYSGTLRDFACLKCSAESFEPAEAFRLIARFQFDHVIEPHQGAEAKVPASEDLFTYFTLIGTCDRCRELLTIASIECS